MKTKTLITAILMICTTGVFSQIINVPNDQPNIQAGINAATNGDTVLVEDGTYFENIKFMGKAITVASRFLIDGNEDHIDNTIIDGSQAANPDSASTVMFINGEDTTSIICGLTIQGGSGLRYSSWNTQYGGGIACWESGPKILNNKIKDNMITTTSSYCGGVGIGSIAVTGTGNWWMVVDNNVISNNMCAANAESAFGGGIYVMTNSIIRNNTIEDNSCYNAGAQADGGGIEVQQLMGVIIAEIHDNIIQNNTVEGNESLGAGIMILNASATISNNEINNNSCIAEEYASGGGIYTYESGEIYIMNNEVLYNTCDANYSKGGGYYCDKTNGDLNITGNEFSNNEMIGVESWLGAGIYIDEFSDFIHIADNQMKENGGNNISWSCGGALVIVNTSDKEVVIENNIIDSNYAQNAAGILTFNLYDVKIQNNVITENYADEKGGGIWFWQYLGNKDNLFPIQNSDLMSDNYYLNLGDTIHPLIINNSFFGNSAGTGGAIYSDHGLETPIILNSVFWENNAGNGKDIYNYGANDIIVSYSDIDTTNIYTPWAGENNIYVDPLFIDDSCHIDKESQCIEAGVTSLEVNGTTYNCPDFDIDGQMRPLNATADIGVDEVLITRIIPRFNKTESLVSLEIYPNPVSANSMLEFSIPQSGHVSITLFDNMGKHLETILSQEFTQGTHKIKWNSSNLMEGVYFCYLKTSFGSQTPIAIGKKMIKL